MPGQADGGHAGSSGKGCGVDGDRRRGRPVIALIGFLLLIAIAAVAGLILSASDKAEDTEQQVRPTEAPDVYDRAWRTGTMMIGHDLIDRPLIHSKPGNLVILSQPFAQTGAVTEWRFFNSNNAKNVWDNQTGWRVTPLILRPVGPDRFEVVAIGRTRTNDSSGVQSFRFDPVEGSAVVWPGFHFGWWDGGPGGINKGCVEIDLGFDETIYVVGKGIESVKLGQTFGCEEINRTYSLQVVTQEAGAGAGAEEANGLVVHRAQVLTLAGERKVRVKVVLSRKPDGPSEVVLSARIDAPNVEIVQAETTATVTEELSDFTIELTSVPQDESRMEFVIRSKDGQDLFALPVFRVNMPGLVRVLPGRSFYTTETEGRILVEPKPALKASSLTVKLSCNGKELAADTLKVEPQIRVPFDLAALPQGESRVVCEITDGALPVATAPVTITRLAPKPNEVKIDYACRGLIVDGSPFFPFGFYTLFPVNDGLIEEEKGHGFNVISPYQHDEYGGPWSREKLAGIRKYMDHCAAVGMKVHYQIIWHGRSEQTDADWANLKEEVEAFRDHPALLCWYLADEPELGTLPADDFVKLYRFVREVDPHHPITIVLAHPELAPFYADAMDIVMVDPYPIPHNPVTMVSDWMDAVQRTLDHTMPAWVVPQAFPVAGRHSIAAEERVMTWLGLIHGATGVQYFIWAPGEHPASHAAWDAARAMASECPRLFGALLTAEPQPSLTSSVPAVHASAWKKGDRITVLAANTVEEPQTVRLQLDGVNYTGKATVLFENREIDVRSGAIEETIGGFGTRTYVVPVGR